MAVAAAIASAANYSAANGVLTVPERIGAMAAHGSLTVVVAYGITKGQKKHRPATDRQADCNGSDTIREPWDSAVKQERPSSIT